MFPPLRSLPGLILTALLVASRLAAADLVLRPSGRILFQPQLLWANSQTTLQGTGYVITHGGKIFGVTSVDYLDFDVGGLASATWLDVYSERPLATFRASLGRPARTTFARPQDAAADFLLLPAREVPEGSVALALENVEKYAPGTALWFPNKNRDAELGHAWLDASVVEDAGHYLRVRVRAPVEFQSQHGTPLLNAATGSVVGMIQGGEKDGDGLVLTLCPARSMIKHLARRQETYSLLTAIRRRR